MLGKEKKITYTYCRVINWALNQPKTGKIKMKLEIIHRMSHSIPFRRHLIVIIATTAHTHNKARASRTDILISINIT
jgi:hypothetical protein